MATHLHSLRNLSENRNLNTVFCSSGKDKMLKRRVIGTKIIILKKNRAKCLVH